MRNPKYQDTQFERDGYQCEVAFGRKAPLWFGGQTIDKAGRNRLWMRVQMEDVDLRVRGRCTVAQWVSRGADNVIRPYNVRVDRIKAATEFTETFVRGHYSMYLAEDKPWHVPFANRDTGVGTVAFVVPGGHVLSSKSLCLGTYRVLSYALLDPPGAGHNARYVKQGSPLFCSEIRSFLEDVEWRT